MQKILPHLWFDKEAGEAARFYTSVFPDSAVGYVSMIPSTPSGDTEIVAFRLAGCEFMAISAGPVFKFNPSISFLVACRDGAEVEALWKPLFEGGTALMELGTYPFSEKFGWVQDRYGLSWQITAMGGRPIEQKITPKLMYVGRSAGRAEEAVRFYTSVFKNASVGDTTRHGKGQDPEREGTLAHALFSLEGQQFAAMDSAYPHEFFFNEAVSLMVRCEDQKEIDYYWGKLSSVPEAEQCGWLKDQFGVSWQVAPKAMDSMLQHGTPEQIRRVTEAFLSMKKFDLAALERAFRGS